MKKCRLRLTADLLFELYGASIVSLTDSLDDMVEHARACFRFTRDTAAIPLAIESKVTVSASGEKEIASVFWNVVNGHGEGAEAVSIQLIIDVTYLLNGEETETMADYLMAFIDQAEASGSFTLRTKANLRAKDVEVLTLETPDSHDLVLARAIVEGSRVSHADGEVQRLAGQIKASGQGL